MAKKGKIYLATFRRELARGMNRREIQNKLFVEVKKEHKRKKRLLLSTFNNHNVTRELDRGPWARANISETLPGLKYEAGRGGNLFSFIGFDAAERPIDVVRKAIIDGFILRKVPKSVTKTQRRGMWKWRFVFKMQYATKDDLAALTPMPWEPGSWIRKIETGISGLGFYIWQRKGFRNSKSGAAVQSRNSVRTTQFRPVDYITLINRITFGKK